MNTNCRMQLISKLWIILVSVLVVVASGCATIKTGSHFNESVNVEGYQTYSWISETPFVGGTMESDISISALTQKKIEDAIEAELRNKGYAFEEDRSQSDFLISYTVGTREKLVLDSYPNYYLGSWAWHVNGGSYYGRNTTSHIYTRGTLGVDVFDRRTDEPVWHGWAEKTITSDDRRDPTSLIKAGVNQLLTNFPR